MSFKEFSEKQQRYLAELFRDHQAIFTVDVDKDLLWETYLDSQDETLYDSNETPYCVFKTESWLNQGMPEDFEKMAGFYGYKYFVLEETGSGFVFLAGMSEKEYKKWLAGLNV